MIRALSLALLVPILACSDSPSRPEPDPGPPEVASVTVSTPSLSLVPGQKEEVQATARDASGSPIPGTSPSWSSSAPGVASVTSAGSVEGVSPGTATLTAEVGGRSGTVAVTVGEGGFVDAEGGTVVALDGALRLEIPAGALSSGVALRVEAVASPPPVDRIIGGTAVRLDPASAAFGPGTTLSLAFPAGLGDSVVVPRLRLARLEGSSWEELGPLPVDRDGRRVAGDIEAGGTYAVFAPPPSMRGLAQLRGVDFGVAVNMDALRNDDAYRDLLASEYTSVTPENVMKFGPIHPAPGSYDFDDADALMEFADDWGMAVHGHVLFWHSQQPGWLTESPTPASLLSALKDHIETVVGRYAGRIRTWDVANEVIADDGSGLRPSFWVETVGPEVIDSAFVWAHRADPDARLYLNDYSVSVVGPKSDSLLALAARLRDAGVPIHGIGLQGHVLHTWPDPSRLGPNLARIATAGFDVRFTELDVRLPDGEDLLDAQAAQYRGFAAACVAEPRCTAVTTWGATDRYSWIPGFFPGFGRALPFDQEYRPKPAYPALREAFGGG